MAKPYYERPVSGDLILYAVVQMLEWQVYGDKRKLKLHTSLSSYPLISLSSEESEEFAEGWRMARWAEVKDEELVACGESISASPAPTNPQRVPLFRVEGLPRLADRAFTLPALYAELGHTAPLATDAYMAGIHQDILSPDGLYMGDHSIQQLGKPLKLGRIVYATEHDCKLRGLHESGNT